MNLTVVGFFLVKELPSWAEAIRTEGKSSVWVPGCGLSPLPKLLAHLDRWSQAGHSCFTKLLNKMKLPPPTESILDSVLPAPDG